MLLCYGREEGNTSYTQCVALMLPKEASKVLLGLESHASRIIETSFKMKKEGIAVNVTQFYAATNDSSDDNRDLFYERIVVECPRKDLFCRTGDPNAKVGIDNTGY